jgi:hypothetical protein
MDVLDNTNPFGMKSFAFCFKTGCPNAIAEISTRERVENSFMNRIKFYK